MDKYVIKKVTEKTVVYVYETPEGLKELEHKEDALDGWEYVGRRIELIRREYRMPLDRFIRECREYMVEG